MIITERFPEIVVEYPNKIILSDLQGEYTASQLYNVSQFILSEALHCKSYKGKRIAVLCHPGLSYVTSMLAGWMSGGVMVPLCISHPPGELQHVLEDSKAELILADQDLVAQIPKLPVKIIVPEFRKGLNELTPANYNNPLENDPALMLYTSGTTGKPKGVVHTHASLSSQIECLVQAWEWTDQDRILHFLPLHHTHGIINKWLCALWTGARCDMLEKFDAEKVWSILEEKKHSLFMAVPTIYVKLIESAGERKQELFDHFRLMVSGSAALPVSVLKKWEGISGHVLLERYGMTETGMVLSNPLHGERRPGTVGIVLPGMKVRIADESGEVVNGEDAEGELQVKGKNLFTSYWQKEKETKEVFTRDGWFRTGDMVRFADGYYSIIGRISTDIMKCGGYKISALEIESALLEHPAISECAVVGIPDETWGEKICAAIVWKQSSISLDEIRDWLKDKLANYKLPALLYNAEQLPRNAMGKVVKAEVRNFVKK